MEWSKFSCYASGILYSLTLRYKRRLLETWLYHFYSLKKNAAVNCQHRFKNFVFSDSRCWISSATAEK